MTGDRDTMTISESVSQSVNHLGGSFGPLFLLLALPPQPHGVRGAPHAQRALVVQLHGVAAVTAAVSVCPV